MERGSYILSTLGAAGRDAAFQPVHVQKLFFLLDKEAAHLFEGPHFSFFPYDYGPFDKSVYLELERLASAGLVEVFYVGAQRRYRLTAEGIERANELLAGLPEDVQTYLTRMANFVRNKSFRDLVSFVYQRYPEMKERSVFV